MTDFEQDGNSIKHRPIWIKFSPNTLNLRNYKYPLRKGDIFHPRLPHGRQEEHLHEAHQEDENLINVTFFTCFMPSFFKNTDLN